MLDQIIAKIAEFDRIIIVAHQHADGDALGSCFGLRTVLREFYQNKEILVMGKHTKDNGTMFPLFDEIKDDLIAESLAVVLDTANAERVDDARFAQAKFVIKIDHHPSREEYGNLNYVRPEISSTSELVTDLARQLAGETLISKEAATYLYAGVMSDTMSFSTNSTNASALETASYLARCGVKLEEVAYHFRAKELPVYQLITEMRSKLVIEEGKLAYVIVTKEMYRKYDLTFEDVKGNVGEFSRILGLYIWCVFIEQEDATYPYQGSLRSRYVGINDIAAKFRGGGHVYAAGVKLAGIDEVYALIGCLRDRIKEGKKNETEFSI